MGGWGSEYQLQIGARVLPAGWAVGSRIEGERVEKMGTLAGGAGVLNTNTVSDFDSNFSFCVRHGFLVSCFYLFLRP